MPSAFDATTQLPDDASSSDECTATDIPADEALWWRQWHDGRDPQARERLAALHLPYARTVAATYYGRRMHDEIEFGDYLQLASLGMMEAMDRFDPARGVRFRTFAARRMHGAILNGLETMTEKQQQIAVRQRLRRERLASLTEAAHPATPPTVAPPLKGDALFSHLADIGIGLALSFLLEGTGMFEGGELASHHPANDTYYRRTELQQLRRRMLEHMDHLKPQARQVIRGHYVQELPFDEIAGMMGVTKGRVSQIHREALQTLRTLLRDTGACDTQL